MSRRRVAGWTAAAVLVLLFGGRWAALRFTEASWFADLGYGRAYWTRFWHDLACESLVAAVAFAWYAAQTIAVYRSIGAVHLPRRVGNLEIAEAVPPRLLRGIAVGLALLLAVVTAMTFNDIPGLATLYGSATPLGLKEPILGHDASFYLAALPLLETLHLAALVMALFGIFIAATLYALTGSITFAARRLRATPHARTHLLVLLTVLALVIAWGFQLDTWTLVGGGGAAQGALAAADRAARLPASTALAALSLVVAGGTAASVAWKRPAVVVALWGALAVGSLFGGVFAPFLSDAWRDRQDQSLSLALDQFADRYSRAGLGVLDAVAPESLRLEATVPADSLAALGRELAGLSPWAVEPGLLGDALSGAAPDTTRPLAWTPTLDTYPAPTGAPALVALAVPEPDPLASERTRRPDWTAAHRGPLSWDGEPLAVTAADARTLTFLARLDPVAESGGVPIPLTRAEGRIRYVAAAAEPAVVGPDEPPPRGGPSGLLLGSFGRRVLLAWALQVPPLLDRRTSYADRLLIWRDVPSRLARLYPFATFDPPRAALVGGRLLWIADGYLASARFPLAEHVVWNGDDVNFLRAPYVATVDAVSGRTRLFLRPPDLPLARALATGASTPALPSDSMSVELKAHLDYPEGLFLAQAQMLARHRGTPAGVPPPSRTWALAARQDSIGRTGPARPADVLALLALGGGTPQPWLLVPFTDAAGTRLLAVAAGTSQPDGVPRLRLLRLADAAFPTLAAAESRLSASPAVLAAMADAAGAEGDVRRSPLVAVPAAGTLAYAQFIFATPERTRQPLLPRGVILYAAGRLGVGDDLAAAARALARAPQGGGGLLGPASSLAAARAAFLALDSASRLRDWEAFARAWDALRRALGLASPTLPPGARP